MLVKLVKNMYTKPLYFDTLQELTAMIIGFSSVSRSVFSKFLAASSHIVKSTTLPLSYKNIV